MVAKVEIESREANCSSAEDYAKLAIEALADPADKEYTSHLLKQAEMQCQFPKDFVETASIYAQQLDDKDYAADLLEQAADACFDGMENATVGNAYALLFNDKQRATELFKEAVDDISDPADVLMVASWAQDNLGDADMAATLFTKIEDGCKTLEDYAVLAKKLADVDNMSAAKTLYEKGARHIDGMEDSVKFALGAKEILNDEGWAKSLLEEAESDAQFPKEFIALAQGFNALGENDKIDDLLEQGAEFAMNGEEYSDLAQGYWQLNSDKDKACSFYEMALSDISDRTQLMSLGNQIALEMKNPELGKKFYVKAKGRITSPGDLTKLAETVFDDLGDKEYAKEIYNEAEKSIVGAHDLIGLADALVNKLGDKAHAASVYQKALESSDDIAAAEKLLSASQATLPDNTDLTRVILTKMQVISENVADLIKTQTHMRSLLDDKAMANTTLALAEDKITSLNEMKAVAEAVLEHNPDDKTWNDRLADKLVKREANQALYDDYQKKEDNCDRASHFLALGTEVIETLDDTFYGRKLYSSAATMLKKEDFSLANTSQLIIAVDKHIKDNDWLKNLVTDASSHINHFSETHRLATLAKQLSDSKLADELSRSLLQDAATKAEAATDVSPLIKVAQSAASTLRDKTWAKELLDSSVSKAQNSYDYIALAKLALDLGDKDKALELIEFATEKAQTPAQLRSLSDSMRHCGMDQEQVSSAYKKGADLFTLVTDKLEWAKNLAGVLGDNQAALSAMQEIQPLFTDEKDKKIFDASLANLKRNDYTRPHKSTS